MIVSIGCYTDKDHPNGLHELAVDPMTGAMTRQAEYPVPYPIYLANDPAGKFLYTTVSGGVASFARRDGKFVQVDRHDCGGTPCHLAAMPDGKSVVWADYSKGTAGSVPVADGRFAEKGTRYVHSGIGPNLPRQDKAHCHQAMPAPDGKSYCVVDLGIDSIVTYPHGRSFTTTPAGAGPRHMVFHPNGRLAFVIFELASLIASYEWDNEKGLVRMLDQRQTLASWPSGRAYNGDLGAAIRLSPDLKRVIVSNRGEQSLVAYDFDEKTGAMSFKARSPLPGSWPRDFTFLDDTLAIVTMERTDEVHTLRYDPETATFKVLATLGGFFRPVAALRWN